MKKRHLIRIVLLLQLPMLCSLGESVQAQGLKLLRGDSVSLVAHLSNPDSLMMDTLSSSVTEGEIYIRTGLRVTFVSNVIQLPLYPADTIIEVTWQQIDTSQIGLRDLFDAIEQEFGSFVFRKMFPADTASTKLSTRTYEIRFASYICSDSLRKFIDTCSSFQAVIPSPPSFMSYVPNDLGMKPGVSFEQLLGVPGQTFWDNQYHPRGWSWNLYAMQVPMAWEITKGRKDRVVGVFEYWGDPYTDGEELGDVQYRTASNLDGNMLFLENSSTTPGDPHNPGDGAFAWYNGHSWKLSKFGPVGTHGLTTLPLVNALGDNSNTSVFGREMVGVAYKATSVALNGGDYWSMLDFDHTEDNTITPLVAVNVSYGARARTGGTPDATAYYAMGDQSRNAILSGITPTFSAGNSLIDIRGLDLTKHSIEDLIKYNIAGHIVKTTDLDNETVYVVYPTQEYGAAGVLSLGTTDLDLKGLAVGASEDGELYDFFCMKWTQQDVAPPHFDGQERLTAAWAFSPGYEKFPATSDPNRWKKKQRAYMDVVAPGRAVFTGSGGLRDTDDDDINDALLEEQLSVNVHGTSQSAPQVAGVVALMRSIFPLQTIPITSVFEDRSGIHRKVYNTITFTADKIPATNINPTERFEMCLRKVETSPNVFECTHSAFFRISDRTLPDDPFYPDQVFDFSYNTQTNDALKRSWHPGVGFGRVNAYRSVAHSIEKKGLYEYQSTIDLGAAFASTPYSDNEDGWHTMHWGALRKFDATDPSNEFPSSGSVVSVLDIGGVSLPGETHKNQGVTLLNSLSATTPITVTVPEECILAIDGIVRQTSNLRLPNRVQTSGTGKILIAGYLDDVELTGQLRISDLIVTSTGSGGTGGIYLKSGFSSELYGNVRVQQNGTIEIDGGTLTMQSGGQLRLEGAKQLVIKNGGILETKGANYLNSLTDIVVENNSVLRINGPMNSVEAKIVVKSGGKLELMPDAQLALKEFKIEPNGTLRTHPGSWLKLTKSVYNVCEGHLRIEGASGRPALVTGNTVCRLVAKTAGIMVRGNSLDPNSALLSSIKMTWANDTNVAIYVSNARKYAFQHVNFIGKRSSADAVKLTYMLQVRNNSQNLPYASSSTTSMIQRLGLYQCKFADFDDLKRGTGENLNTSKYDISGFWASNLKRATVYDCDFHYLNTGGHITSTAASSWTYNNFQTCNQGAREIRVAPYFCRNSSDSTEFPVTTLGDFVGKFRANSMHNSRTVLSAIGSERLDMKFNNFYGWYTTGIRTLDAIANLSFTQNQNNGTIIELGRNKFDPSSSLSPYPGLITDIVYEEDGEAQVAEGKNFFSTNSNYHLYHSGTGTKNVSANNNEWVDGSNFNVRTFNVAASGVTLNTSLPPQQTCSDVSIIDASTTQVDRCPPSIVMNLGEWPDLDSTSSVLTTSFAYARSAYANTAYADPCRGSQGSDALLLASLSDSSLLWTTALKEDYRAVIANTASSPVLVRSSKRLLAAAHEILGAMDSASLVLATVTPGTEQLDSATHAWMLSRLTNLALDSIELEDSLNALLNDRIIEDQRSFDAGASPKPTTERSPKQEGRLAILSASESNANIIFTLESIGNDKLEVGLYDVLGRLVYSESISGIADGISIRRLLNLQLSAGAYFLRISSVRETATMKIRAD